MKAFLVIWLLLLVSFRQKKARNKMGYIKEPKGVDFVFEPHIVTEEDKRIISEAIAHYKATGKFKKVAKPKRARRAAPKKAKR